LVMLGVLSRYLKTSLKWNTKTALNVSLVHKATAYSFLLAGYVAIATGIHDYRTNPKHPFEFPLELVHLVATVGIVTLLEIFNYVRLLKENEF